MHASGAPITPFIRRTIRPSPFLLVPPQYIEAVIAHNLSDERAHTTAIPNSQ